METIQAQYQFTVGDFRMASYYGLFLRNRRGLLLAGGIAALAILYYALGALGYLPATPLLSLIGILYIAWILFLMALTERGIRRYLQSPGCMIGKDYRFTFAGDRIRLHIPSQNIRRELPVRKLTVFELHALFLLYVDAQQVYIIPKSAFTEDQVVAMRGAFRKMIPERCSSRF